MPFKDSGIVIVFKIMKWCLRMVLVIFGFAPLFRRRSGYRGKKGKVTFNGEAIADKTFVALNKTFAKNDSAVYYKRYNIPDADYKTFTALDRHYAKDAQTVFYCDEEREGQNYYLTKHSVIIKVKDAHSHTFNIMGEGYEGYAKDQRRAYCKGVGFEVEDVSSLTIIEGRFVKDNYKVYFEQVPVNGADAKSFETLNNWYAKDAKHAYYYGYHNDLYNGIHQIPCHVESFTILDYPYSKDDESAFYAYIKIQGSHAPSFSVLGNRFSKDQNHVYLDATILSDADAETFMVIPHDENVLDDFNYSKDKSNVFWKGKKFGEVDLANFKVLGLDYATDGKHVYYQTCLLKNADPATFSVYDHGYGDADAKDRKHKYLKGKIVVV